MFRLLRDVARVNGIQRAIDLRLDEQSDAEPVALGCVRWTIVLPVGLDDSMTDDELRAVLAHELGHLVRRDYAWKLFGHALCVAAAFQPLNFVARRRWEKASEYLCDQWATQHGAARLELATSLTKLAEQRFRRRSTLIAVGATGSKPVLVQRIERLVDDTELDDAWQSKHRTRLLHVASLVAITSVIVAAPSLRAIAPRTAPLLESPTRRSQTAQHEPTPLGIAPNQRFAHGVRRPGHNWIRN